MKRLFSVVMLAVIALTSCEKDNYHYNNELEPGYGLLSFAGADITVSEEVETRATNIGDYFIWIYAVENGNETAVKLDKSEGSQNNHILYSAIPAEGIKLPAGNYKLVAQSASSIADAGQTAVYGAEREFSITAGQTTDLSSTPIVCTLWQQVEVYVGYNDFFLEHLVGDGMTTVKLSDTAKLDFKVKGNGTIRPVSIDKRPGYLKVPKNNGDDTDKTDEVTLQVEFEGLMKVKNDDGSYTNKSQKMRAAIPNVKARQCRNIEFEMTEDKDGNANFTITIDGLVEDVPLTEDVNVTEGSFGEDPNKPQGDGGIKLMWTAGSTDDVRDLWNEYTTQNADTGVVEKPSIEINEASLEWENFDFEAIVPSGVYEFNVDILSTNDIFNQQVADISVGKDGKIFLTNTGKEHLSVIKQLNDLNIEFPYPNDVIGAKSVEFPLTNALVALKAFEGTHTFIMHVVSEGGENTIALTLFVPKSN